MAEALAALGVVASVAQLADYGFKLSIRLFAYAEAVSRADRSSRSLSNEVSMTSAVLKELGTILENDKLKYVSERAVEATRKTTQECLDVFSELDEVLVKAMGAAGAADKRGEGAKISTLDKLRWPFIQPKMELLQGRLDKLKASLTLMLQVLSFARDLSSKKQQDASADMQRQVIETLAKSEQEAKKRYEMLLMRLEGATAGALNTGEGPPPYISTAVTPQTGGPRDPNARPDESKPTIGQLILCINLVHQVLEMHMKDSEEADFQRYRELWRAVEMAKRGESSRMEEKYGAAAFDIMYKASKDVAELHLLLRTLTSAYPFLLPPAKQQAAPVATTYSSTIEYVSPKSELLQRPGSVKTTPHKAFRYDQNEAAKHALNHEARRQAARQRSGERLIEVDQTAAQRRELEAEKRELRRLEQRLLESHSEAERREVERELRRLEHRIKSLSEAERREVEKISRERMELERRESRERERERLALKQREEEAQLKSKVEAERKEAKQLEPMGQGMKKQGRKGPKEQAWVQYDLTEVIPEQRTQKPVVATIESDDVVNRLLAEWTNLAVGDDEFEEEGEVHRPAGELSRPGTFGPSDVKFDEDHTVDLEPLGSYW